MIRPHHTVLALLAPAGLALGLILATGAMQASAQDAEHNAALSGTGGEATINRNEIWRDLYPDNPDSPNSPNFSGDPNVPVSSENPLHRRYHWAYARRDPATGQPLQIAEGDPRIGEIDEYRTQCIKIANKLFIDDGVPLHIAKSKFDNLQDQATEIVLACVNHLYLQKERWLKGVGVIACEAHTNHCWGPRDVWERPPSRGVGRGMGR